MIPKSGHRFSEKIMRKTKAAPRPHQEREPHEACHIEGRDARRKTHRRLARPNAVRRCLVPGAYAAGGTRRLAEDLAASGDHSGIAGEQCVAVGSLSRARRAFATTARLSMG